MFSLKRIIFIILSVVVIGAVFLVANSLLSNSAANHGASNASGQREFLPHRTVQDGDKPNILVIGRGDIEETAGIMSNVTQICEDLQLSVVSGDVVDEASLSSCDILVLCDSTLSQYVSSDMLEQFVSSGGNVILAAGIAGELENESFHKMLGIESISGQRDYSELLFEEPFLPLQPEKVTYGGASNSSRIRVDSDATVFVRNNDDGTPLLYMIDSNTDVLGGIFVINGTFLNDSGNRGLFTGAISALMPDFIYPVLGIKAVFLDNFPAETEENDKLCQRLYGYTTERFMESVIWPAFQGMLLRTDTPYTASLLVEASSEESFDSDTGKVFFEVAKTLPQFNCELAFAASCDNQERVVVDQSALEEFKANFPSYTVKGLVLEDGSFSQQLLDIPGANIDCVREPATINSLPFAWEDGRAILPTVTEGNNLRSGDMLEIYSTIGAYGLVSHAFDLGAMICDDDGDTASWESDKREIGAFESDVLSRAGWLQGRTLSHAKEDVQSYRTLEYGWESSDEQVEVRCSDAAVGQAFLYHTSGTVIAAQGLSYQDLGNGFYLLRVENNICTVQLEGRDR